MDRMNDRMERKMDGMMDNMDARTQAFKSDMRAMRGEMRQVGQCLQADIMVPPRATTSELRGSAPAGEDRVIRETCWARRVEVTATVTQREKLNGVTETCTRHVETREITSEVTEYTETREVVERLHGVEVKDAHTHIQVVRDNGGELAQRVETRCEQLGVLPREQGEGVCPLEAGHGQVDSARWIRSCRARLRG